MIIQSMELENFRNYHSLKLELDKGTNIFYGDNAQGKTNILEALYLSGTTRSHKGSKDRDIIYFGEQESHLRTCVEKRDVLYQIDMHLRKNKTKGIAINGVPIRKASQLFGILNFVFFSPEDLSIIKQGPSERRRFLDMELCQLDRVYLHELAQYNKIVVQRNKLLKDLYFRPELSDTLDIWDQQLCQYGQKLILSREAFIEKLNEIIVEIHSHLSGGRERLQVVYERDVSMEDLGQALIRNRERDLKLKTTTTGPHRDDLLFLTDGIDIRKFGSQGQQRTAALSLKLSEIELVKKITGDTPVLLLDDVLSELDHNRQNYLLDRIYDIQTIITCTGLDEFISRRFSVNRVFRVTEGAVTYEDGKNF
ncbi:MAG: DNA replication/repair protein RecF [Lachnospiraceae bacterium]|jgi:DNA replication and repair protein RecF|nr:DNA replication/repair protein RecF [Lachnospiraceae bacterium]MCI8996666.1 DNA replication/repair protein RecF [Lachnospiraceae bacterium]